MITGCIEVVCTYVSSTRVVWHCLVPVCYLICIFICCVSKTYLVKDQRYRVVQLLASFFVLLFCFKFICLKCQTFVMVLGLFFLGFLQFRVAVNLNINESTVS